MKKMAALFLILLAFGFIGMIRSNDPVMVGEEVEMHVNVINDFDYDLDDVKLRMYIYDLGLLIKTNDFDIEDNENTGRFLYWDTEGVAPGSYLARISASNEDFRSVKYRYITII